MRRWRGDVRPRHRLAAQPRGTSSCTDHRFPSGSRKNTNFPHGNLEQLLPERARRRVHALGAATVPYPASGPMAEPETLLAIATACRDHERLSFAYRSHADERSRRLVEPAGSSIHVTRWSRSTPTAAC